MKRSACLWSIMALLTAAMITGCGSSAEVEDLTSSETSSPSSSVELPLGETGETDQTEEAPETFESLMEKLAGKSRCSLSECARLVAFAEDDPANPLVVKAAKLVFADQRSPNWRRIQAMGRLLAEHHIDSPELGGFCEALGRVDGGQEILQKVLTDSPHGDVRAYATFWVASRMVESDEATELLEQVASFEGPLPYRRSDLRVMARGKINLARLKVGNVAPDIVGTDIDGAEFKLSDYRGKVVFLDFWGDW